MARFEILEHTADVGVRAVGDSLEEAFAQATRGLADIVGIWHPDGGDEVTIELEGGDAGALLVDWLSEVLYLHDARDAVLAGVRVDEVAAGRVRGVISLAPREDRAVEGTQVKAITYHQLRVERLDGNWIVEVYLDV